MGNPLSQLGPEYFQQAAMNLLPRGLAWPRDLDTVFGKFMGAIGDMFARAHNETTNITDNELYPPSTAALITEWEKDWGLPDPCTPQPQSLEQRVAALLAKITDQGNLSRQKFIDLAKTLGFEITITEYRPFTCVSACADPVTDTAWRFAWQVNAPETTVGVLTCIGDCVSPLRWWGNEALECAISRRNRPSRFVLFSYG